MAGPTEAPICVIAGTFSAVAVDHTTEEEKSEECVGKFGLSFGGHFLENVCGDLKYQYQHHLTYI